MGYDAEFVDRVETRNAVDYMVNSVCEGIKHVFFETRGAFDLLVAIDGYFGTLHKFV